MSQFSKAYLTKKEFKNFCNCAKKAWIERTKANSEQALELQAAKKITINKKKFPYLSEVQEQELPTQEKLLEPHQLDGAFVEKCAAKYFYDKYPDHFLVNLKDYQDQDAINQTKTKLLNHKIKVYFEASFAYKNVFTRCDVLVRNEQNNTFNLIEIKSVTNFKKHKEEYLNDLAFQYYVLTSSGLKINKVCLMLLNKEYKRSQELNLQELFCILEETPPLGRQKEVLNFKEYCASKVNNTAYVIKQINLFFETIDNCQLDICEMLKHKYCNILDKQFDDAYCESVYKYIPSKNTIFNLAKLWTNQKMILFYDYDQINIANLNSELVWSDHGRLKNFSLVQKRQIEATKNKTVINKKNLAYLLKEQKKYQYPVFMYDFETTAFAVPAFSYSTCYQQIPFQYSIQILNNDQFDFKNKANITTKSFLASSNQDPRLAFIKQFVQDTQHKDNPVCVAYNMSFEKGTLNKLIEYLDDLATENKHDLQLLEQYKQQLQKVINNTIDMMDFFKKFDIYKDAFNGSCSIKYVLPAFVPEMTYDNLTIKKGDQASAMFYYYALGYKSQVEWEPISDALTIYCNQDTLAMVALLSSINSLLKPYL